MTNKLEAFNPTESAQVTESGLKAQWSLQDSSLARQMADRGKNSDVESLGFTGFHDFSIVDDKDPSGNENAKDVPKDVHENPPHTLNRDQPQYPEARAGGTQIDCYEGSTTSYKGEDSETKGPYMDVKWTKNADGTLSKAGWEIRVDENGLKCKDTYNQDGSHVQEFEKPDGQRFKSVTNADGTSTLEIFHADGTGHKTTYDKNGHSVSRDVFGKDGKITHEILD